MHPILLTIKWFGQACFLLTTAAGLNILFDPYHDIGYKHLDVKANVVFVSHEHFDHNATELVKGNPYVIMPLPRGKEVVVHHAPMSVSDLKEAIKFPYTAIQSFHDQKQGKERGLNTIRVVEIEGIRVCHLGDLGTTLTDKQIKEIGKVDVLMIPVGGVYTIDGKTAIKVVHQLNPKIVITMHYNTPPLKIGLNTDDEFLAGFKNVKHVDELKLSKDSLPKETTVYVLNY